MNREGQHTDRRGRVLNVDDHVVVVWPDDPLNGQTGVIKTLPPEGNDWNGFPYVRMLSDGKLHHVPDSALELLHGDDTVGQLEKAISATKDYHLALRELIARVKGSGWPAIEIVPGTFARRNVHQIRVGDQVLVERDPDKGLLPVRWQTTKPSTLLLRSADAGQPAGISDPFLVPVTAVRKHDEVSDTPDQPGDEVVLETAEGPVFVEDNTAVAVPIIEVRSGQ